MTKVIKTAREDLHHAVNVTANAIMNDATIDMINAAHELKQTTDPEERHAIRARHNRARVTKRITEIRARMATR